MDISAVPFKVTRQGGDVFVSVETKGMMRLEDDELVIEFVDIATDYRSSGMQSEKSDLQEQRIPLAQVDSVTYGRRVIRASMLELRCVSLSCLAGVPFADGNRVTVRVARADRERARDFAATVGLALADRHLKRLGHGEE